MKIHPAAPESPQFGALWFGGGSSSPNTQQVVSSQQIPAFEQQFAQENQNIARSIAQTPFPQYQGQRVANLTPDQTASFGQVEQATQSYQPFLNAASGLTAQGAQAFPQADIGSYMSPYLNAALAPQIQQLQLQQAQNAKNIGANATQAGAFGDARQGAAEALNNFYGNLSMNDLLGQGYNTAFNTGMQAFQNDQSRALQAGQQYGQLGSTVQNLGLTGANALNQAGTQQQNQNQSNLNLAYQDFMNQVNWPIEMLNLRTSVLANSPYSTTRVNTLPPTNTAAQNLGGFASLAGLLGGSVGGGQAGAQAPFGGQPLVG